MFTSLSDALGLIILLELLVLEEDETWTMVFSPRTRFLVAWMAPEAVCLGLDWTAERTSLTYVMGWLGPLATFSLFIRLAPMAGRDREVCGIVGIVEFSMAYVICE